MKIKNIVKVLFSLLISFCILNGFCYLYYNVPVHEKSEHSATDYVWEKGKFYSRGTEGFAWGTTDDNGYNNPQALSQGDIDILFMGSSHMEAFNVLQEQSAVVQLNGMFAENNIDITGYNIGISAHRLSHSLFNFADAVASFAPTKYVVIETSSVYPEYDELKKISNGSFEGLESNANPILIFLQKIPLVRRLYSQLDNLGLFDDKADANNSSESIAVTDERYIQVLDEALSKISRTAADNDVKVLVVYHPTLCVDAAGEVYRNDDDTTVFKSVCDRNEIVFIDMFEPFCDYYDATYRLPHGFVNTAVGEGHLNKYGHQLIARTIFEKIVCLEEQSNTDN